MYTFIKYTHALLVLLTCTIKVKLHINNKEDRLGLIQSLSAKNQSLNRWVVHYLQTLWMDFGLYRCLKVPPLMR